MAATRLIAMHQNKGRSLQKCLKDRTDYAQNPEKTEGGELVSSYQCDPEFVEEQFSSSKREYLEITGRKIVGDIIAYQIRQSFKPGEITPEEANRIGYETAMRWTKGQHAFIVATHVDKAHIHNHIIYNSTALSCDRKFRNFWFSGVALQRVSDLVCLENGLSVIEPVKPGERVKRTEYPERRSFREDICDAIDACLEQNPKDMDELLRLLLEIGYESKRGKYVSVKGKGQKKFLRFRSLGAGYREQDLERIFAGESREKVATVEEKTEPKLDMLLDIQKMISKGKGPGYERWAKVHNIKQMAQTLLFLEEHNLRDYDELASKAKSVSDRFAEITERQKSLEARLAEIADLKKHIINYSKTKQIYVAYHESGYSKKFFEEHRQEITIHKAAKQAFDELQIAKLPSMQSLYEEFHQLAVQKKQDYAEYRQIRKEKEELLIAKRTVETILNIDRQKEQEKEQEKEEKKNFR